MRSRWITIRFVALLTACVAVGLLGIPWNDREVVVQTDRDLDIAIVGRGNLRLFDPVSKEIRFTRFGALHVNRDSQLSIEIQGEEWLIDPGVSLPMDWQRVGILSDGRIQVLVAGEWIEVGQLQVSLFGATPDFAAPLLANVPSKLNGTPTVCIPGEMAGIIQQGWLEKNTASYADLAVRILLAAIAASVLSLALDGFNSRKEMAVERQARVRADARG